MSLTVGDFLLRRLSEWGIKRIFGFPGDGITGIIAALDRAGDQFDFVQVRHEEMAAFMACAHAKFTGEVGVCLATSGPGRHPSLEWSVRCASRSPAGGSHCRAAGRWRLSAATISRKSISFRCSRMSRASTSTWPRLPIKCATLLTVRCASRKPSAL